MFYAVDADGSGDLTIDELAVVIRGWYKENKMARSLDKAKIELQAAMDAHDTDVSGSLNFLEFLTLWSEAEEWFKFEVAPALKKHVIWLAKEEIHSEADEILAELRGLFLDADAERDGLLTVSQLAAVFQECYKTNAKIKVSRGKKAVTKEVEEAMLRHDLDRSGSLDWIEFVLMWASGGPTSPIKLKVDASIRAQVVRYAMLPVTREAAGLLNDLVALFDAADTDGSGLLDREELTAVFAARYREEAVSRAEKTVRGEVDIAMITHNTDQSGLVDFVEFVQMFSGPPFKFCTSGRVRGEMMLLLSQLERANHEQQLALQVQLHELQNEYHANLPVEAQERLHVLQDQLEESKLRRVKPAQSEVELRVRKVLEAAFSHLDANHDGKLEESELMDMMMRASNVNSEEEARKEARHMISELDQDNDGAISQEEWLLLEDRIVEELMDWVCDIDDPKVVERLLPYMDICAIIRL